MRFVNVYEVTQAYGGPEEGGWWYRHREPVQSKPCRRMRQAREHLRKLKARYEPQSTGAGHILGGGDFPDHDIDPNDMTGVIQGSDYEVEIENVPAVPTGRPRYE